MSIHTWASFLSKRLRARSKIAYASSEASPHSLVDKKEATKPENNKKETQAKETTISQSNEETNNAKSSFAIDNIIEAEDTAGAIINDANNNGLVDDSGHYQIIHNGQTIDLTNAKGRKLSDRTNSNWDAVKAVQSDSGFQVLLEGMGSKEGKFKIWQINENGTITGNSKWKTTAEALTAGWDSDFGDVFQADDTAGPINNDDNNNDGFVDDSPHYKLIGNDQIIDLTNAKGRKLSDSTSAKWDAIKAVQSDSGFQVLLEGMGSKEGKFKIWQINENGTITGNSKWKTTAGALTAGWDSDFRDVFQPDDTNININDGNATFNIQGTPEVGESLTAALVDNDPDGNGLFNYTWQSSTDDATWETIASGSSLTISQDLEGQQVQARISYTDAEAHSENVYTGSVTIARRDDFTEDSRTTGRLSIGGTSSGELEEAGDSDWFQVSLIEGAGYEFNQVGNSLSDPYLYLRGQNGTILLGNDDGGTGLNSRITFDATTTSTYYLDAGSYQNSLTGSYTVSATQTSAPPPPDGDDFSEDTNTTGRLNIGGSSTGELEEAGDTDWFEVSLTGNTSYQFDQIGDTLRDPYLYLRDQNGIILLGNDDGGTGLDSRITFDATNTGSYYLDAGSYQNSQTGSYTLNAIKLEPGFSSIDGWGEVSASGAFEQLMDINLPSVDDLGGNLWGLDNVNAPEVWAGGSGFSGVTGEGVIVAVIDTGVDLDHPEFIGRITDGYDFVDDDTIADDGDGHGTHVAGTIAGSHNDGVGISGVAPDAQIMPIRVLDDNGSGYTSDIIEGIIWSTDNGADVINMSLGGGGYSQAMADAIEYASNNGTVVVMAAGNSRGSSPDYPAAHAIDHGIAVGAVDQNRNMASFSNLAGNTILDYVTAPGQYIYSSVPNGNYDFLSGTSMATPHVAGVAALLKSYDNSLSASTIEDLLTGTASNAPSTIDTTELLESSNSASSFSSNTVITSETLHQFSEDQLSTRLIGRVGSNNSQANNDSMPQTGNSIQTNLVSDIQSIDSKTANFISVDLTDSSNPTSSSEFLSSLLDNNYFEYFEIDSLRTTMQYTNKNEDLNSSPSESKDELTGEALNPSIISIATQRSSQTDAVNTNRGEKAQKSIHLNTIETFQSVEESTLSLNPSQFSDPSESLESSSLESKDELTGVTLNPSIISMTEKHPPQANQVNANTADKTQKSMPSSTAETFELVDESPVSLGPSQWSEPSDMDNLLTGLQSSDQIEILKADSSLGMI